jgi:hypothetical protein
MTNEKLGKVVYDCQPSYVGSVNRRTKVYPGPEINATSYLKNNQVKRPGGMAQDATSYLKNNQVKRPGGMAQVVETDTRP